ncbi:MAG: 3-hydroxyacyl-CoA dehydrogenase/enoyl-CoA hydratase family protein [bacterium]
MKQINKVAVLGAGVMGATIAAHLANAGLDVLLLDIVPKEPNEAEKAKGLTLNDKAVRNRFAMSGLENVKKAKPAAFFLPEYAANIEVGNFEDDIAKLKECDWIIEVVVENMDIKKKLFAEKVAPNMKKGAILSSNTSGLSINEMATVLPEAVKKNFLGTHFFNPPRYMRLLEIIPCKHTSPEVIEFMANFIEKRLGKGIVYAKDTVNFIANRIGVYAICNAIKHMIDMDMTVEEVDAVNGPATAKPKTAVFKTADLVGLDVLYHVANNSYTLLPNDEERDVFQLPEFFVEMVKKGILGNKTKGGFYKKDKGANGSKTYYFDYKTKEYVEVKKPKFGSLEAVKMIDDPAKRLQAVIFAGDKVSNFAWNNLRDTLIYTLNRIPEIADNIVNIDNAMKWGFNWELGPFEMFDAIGVKNFVKRAEKDGKALPEVLKGIDSFYKFENGKEYYYCVIDKTYKEVPRKATQINLTILKKAKGVVEKNSGASLVDIGDGVFCLEFHTKMNAIGGEILSMIHKSIKRAEEEGQGLVIANHGSAFSAGANLMLLAIAIAEGSFDDINMTVKAFQKAMMAIKYSKIPVVAAPHSLALGGGCETCLHADAINPYAETYMGLVEIGVGLLPAGGGTKEMAIRAINLAEENNADVSAFIFKNFMNIAQAKVSMSAAELYKMGFLKKGDQITMNIDNLIHDAKQKVIALADNYRPAKPLTELKAPGRSVAASIHSQLWNMKAGNYITEYEEFLGKTIAHVICGGDVPAGTLITEQYLLDLEREAFLKLCGQKKTLERIQHMLKKGKPLRN